MMQFKKMNGWLGLLMLLAPHGVSISATAQDNDRTADAQSNAAMNSTDNSAPAATPDNSIRTGYSPTGVAIATSSPTGSMVDNQTNPSQNSNTSPSNVLTVDNGDGTTTTTTIITTTTRSPATPVTPGVGGTLSGNGNMTYPLKNNVQNNGSSQTTTANSNPSARAPAPGNDQATTGGNQYAQQQQQLSPEDARVRAGHPAIYWILIVFAIIGGIYYAIQSSSPRKL